MNAYPQLDLTTDKGFEAYAFDNYDSLYMGRIEAISEMGRPVSDPDRSDDKWRTVPGMVLQLANTAIAFPALLSAEKNWFGAIDETCWFARGETNIETLNSHIWDLWADDIGDCGPIYGEMWRRWPDLKAFPDVTKLDFDSLDSPEKRVHHEILRMRAKGYKETALVDNRILFEGHIDQLLIALNEIKSASRSRRIKVQTFNPGYLGMQGLPPCHTNFEFNVLPSTMYEQTIMRAAHGESHQETLHIEVTLRSSDGMLGLPFNVIGYSALHHLFAKYCRMNIGTITINSANAHVYEHHWDALQQQHTQYRELVKEVRTTGQPMQYPILRIDNCIYDMSPKELLDNIEVGMFNLEGYNPKPRVKGRVTK